MKKIILVLFILFALVIKLSAVDNPDYHNGNGTIISIIYEENYKITIRKSEQNVEIGDLASEKSRIVYKDYFSQNIVGQLNDNDNIHILQTCRIDFYGVEKPQIWYFLEKDDIEGWIFIASSDYSDPYRNNCWEIIEIIDNGIKKWTVRKMEQTLSVWENLNIRNNPGVTGTEVLYTIKPGTTDPVQSNVTVIAMTEERELIDGSNEHWLKVEYKGITGWIFGVYASAERGGPKYHIPEYSINFDLGWY